MSRPETFEQAVDAILAEVREVLIERQRTHGAQAIDEIGKLGIYHMIRNKAARLHAKIDGDDWRNDPTDDCVDGIGYNVIALMDYRGWWGLPLERTPIEAFEEACAIVDRLVRKSGRTREEIEQSIQEGIREYRTDKEIISEAIALNRRLAEIKKEFDDKWGCRDVPGLRTDLLCGGIIP